MLNFALLFRNYGILLVTIGLNIALVPRIGVTALAIAGAVGAWCNILLLGGILQARGFFTLPARVLGRVVRIALASAVMGAALFALMGQIEPWFVGSILDKALGIAAILAVGAVTYGGAGAALAFVGRLLRALPRSARFYNSVDAHLSINGLRPAPRAQPHPQA